MSILQLPGPSGGKALYGGNTLNQGVQLNHLRYFSGDPMVLIGGAYDTYKKTGDLFHSLADPSGDDPLGIWPHEPNAEYQAKLDKERAEQMVKGKYRMRMKRKKQKMKDYRKRYGYALGGLVDPRIQSNMRTNEMYRNRTMPINPASPFAPGGSMSPVPNDTVYAGGSPTFNESAGSQYIGSPTPTGGSSWDDQSNYDPEQWQQMQNFKAQFGQSAYENMFKPQQMISPIEQVGTPIGNTPTKQPPTMPNLGGFRGPISQNPMSPMWGRGRPMPVNPVTRFRMATNRARAAGGPFQGVQQGSAEGIANRQQQMDELAALTQGPRGDRYRQTLAAPQQRFNGANPVYNPQIGVGVGGYSPLNPYNGYDVRQHGQPSYDMGMGSVQWEGPGNPTWEAKTGYGQTGGLEPMPQNPGDFGYAGGSPNFNESTGQYMSQPMTNTPDGTNAATGMGGKLGSLGMYNGMGGSSPPMGEATGSTGMGGKGGQNYGYGQYGGRRNGTMGGK